MCEDEFEFETLNWPNVVWTDHRSVLKQTPLISKNTHPLQGKQSPLFLARGQSSIKEMISKYQAKNLILFWTRFPFPTSTGKSDQQPREHCYQQQGCIWQNKSDNKDNKKNTNIQEEDEEEDQQSAARTEVCPWERRGGFLTGSRGNRLL